MFSLSLTEYLSLVGNGPTITGHRSCHVSTSSVVSVMVGPLRVNRGKFTTNPKAGQHERY